MYIIRARVDTAARKQGGTHLENQRIITDTDLRTFTNWLKAEEKARSTIEKYGRDIRKFSLWMNGAVVTKEAVAQYKHYLLHEQNRKPTGINGVIAALNSFFAFTARDIRLKSLKTQRQTFRPKEKVLNKDEYKRLLLAAQSMGNMRLNLVLQAICSTGIRVSELRFITINAALSGETEISNKGKTRTVFLPKELSNLLLTYARKRGIHSGSIFVTKNGKPLDRSNIWAEMKKLCGSAKVAPSKVFPHNLRALFARRFYSIDKDIAGLADLLGHSSVDTTRIYLMDSGEQHRRRVDSLRLIMT